MQRAKWVLVCLLLAPALHALEISYGSFLTITGIHRSNGKIALPAERKKYHNIRILNKRTYQFVKACPSACVQEVPHVEVTVSEVRPAQTRPDMWRVTCSFNEDWQATFLVFGQGEKYQVKAPADLVFKQDVLKKETEELVVSAVKELK